MSLSHDVCRLFYARRSKAVDPVGSRERVDRDWIRWHACKEEERSLQMADRTEGLDTSRCINVKGTAIFRTLRHAAALALAEPDFFRARLAECPEMIEPKPSDLAKAEDFLARFREPFAAWFEGEAARFMSNAEWRRSRGEPTDDTEIRAAAFLARAHEVRAAG